jgi:hypothetical protein
MGHKWQFQTLMLWYSQSKSKQKEKKINYRTYSTSDGRSTVVWQSFDIRFNLCCNLHACLARLSKGGVGLWRSKILSGVHAKCSWERSRQVKRCNSELNWKTYLLLYIIFPLNLTQRNLWWQVQQHLIHFIMVTPTDNIYNWKLPIFLKREKICQCVHWSPLLDPKLR